MFINEELQAQIIKEYINGKSISKLQKELSLPYRNIQKILKENNISIRGGRKRKTLSDIQLKELKELFYNGVTYEKLSQYFNLDKETLHNIIQENNFIRKNNNRINKNIISDYFSNIDCPEKAYWIGLLYTDGSVDHYKTTGRIRLQLKNEDIEILEKLKQDLQLDCSIIYDKRIDHQCASIEFTDEQIFNDLSQFGIIPNKTYRSNHLIYDKIPNKFIPAYLLGLFDGDGCLTYPTDFSTDVTFGFTTYFETVAQDFQFLIDSLINKQVHNKIIFTNAWHVNWRGKKQVLEILDLLYKNSPRYLQRKYQKYLSLKNSLK